MLGGHVCSHASVPPTRAFMHKGTTREAVVTCGQTQHERESFMATPVYAQHPMPHLWGYRSNSQRKDASTRPPVVRNRSAINGTSQITNQMTVRNRNKRRLQGRPNVRWPAQTLCKCAKTHKQHEKGETRLRRAHKRAAPGKLKTRGMHHSENKQQCYSTKNIPVTEGRQPIMVEPEGAYQIPYKT